jgi:ABC-type branched-subunit amino acid transport system ATPase component/ABC-type branched-subunit amino acid transport system permease subunit
VTWRASRLLGSRTTQAGVVLTVLVLIGTRVSSHRDPMGTALYGVLYGSINGLMAIGLVLTYRVTRAINFAYGSMGGLAAGIGASLYIGRGWPWPAVVALSIVLGGVIGAAVGALINWRFAKAPRLVLTVATIGLSQLLGGLAVYVPRYFHGPSLIPGFKTGLNKMQLNIKPVLFTGNDLVALLAVPIVVVGVSWFLLGTDAGRAVRAIADNADRARLVGIPARRLLLAVWTLSGVVAGLAVILQAPRSGVPLDAAAGPEILILPLAAAVVAGMESLTGAFAVSVGLGVMVELIGLNVSKQAVQDPILLVVVLVALLARARSESRAEAADESSWSAGGALKPIPAALRSLREVRVVKVVAFVALALFALSLPAWLQPGRLDEVSVGLVFGLAGLSLVEFSGWAGTVSLGQMAFVGVGAIAAGDLMMHLNLDLFFSLVVAGAAGAAIAVVLGSPALRVRGIYLAVVTLIFAVAANDFFFNPTNYPKALPSAVLRPVLWKRFDLHGEGDLYLLCLGMLVVAIVLVRGLRQARSGRVVLATRDNLRGAEAVGVPTARTRITAFIISGVIAGMAGGLYVVILGSVGYQTFPPQDSITVFSMVVIGGLSSVSGALAGVALIQWIGIEFPQTQLLLTGVGVLIVLGFFPSGLTGLFERVRDRLLVPLARRRGIDTSVWGDAGSAVDTLPVEPVVAPSDDGDERVLLRCSGVNAAYGQLQVLFGIDLTVHEGEIVALLGTNGAGKSSLLKSVTGLLPASKGRVTFAGRDITSDATERIAASGLTMMPGGRGVFPSLTVGENLRVASWPLRKDRAAAAEARARATTMFPVLEERGGQIAGNLSGGEQQMLSLAMAFLVKPKLLCIDELSLGLAPTVVALLVDAVKEIHREGVTVVIVEQSVNVALLLAERATFLEKGQVRFTGPAADLLDRPDLLRAVFIGGSKDSPNGSSVGSSNGTPAAARTRRRDRVAAAVVAPEAPEAEPSLETVSLTKRFGGITAVDGVDLRVMPHEVVGLIGHNGAGKTTLFDLICGFLTPSAGRIYMDRDEITDLPPYERALFGLGRSFQEARLFPSLTVAETISVALERHLVSREPVAAAFRFPASTDSEAAVAERAAEVIDLLGLSAFRHRPTGELSTGTRRIVELACVMAQRPSLLLLDEPSGGVAQAETEALGPLLRRVATDTGCSMVVIEHDMTLISGLCDRLVALELGAVIADGPPGEVLSHPAVIASYLGTDEATVSRSGRRRPVRART